MSFGKRIKLYIEYKGLNIRSFEKASKLKNGAIHRVVKNNTTLNGESIAAIGREWKDLNLNWLITGDGEMLLHSLENTKPSKVKKQRELLWYRAALKRADEHIRLQNELIESLKKLAEQ